MPSTWCGPGVTTDKIAEVWPTAAEIGMKDEHAAFGLQFGHGLGVGLYEFPMISRLHSIDAPVELEVGMVFALETYCPARDGRSAARIEEEVIVTPTGPQVITRFPADELLVAGRNYVHGADFVDGRLVRDELTEAYNRAHAHPKRGHRARTRPARPQRRTTRAALLGGHNGTTHTGLTLSSSPTDTSTGTSTRSSRPSTSSRASRPLSRRIRRSG